MNVEASMLPEDTVVDPVRFSPVRMDKLIVLSVLTLGIYQIPWMFRNWKYVKRVEDSNIWPWARALFSPIWYYAFLKRLDVPSKGGLALSYWVVSVSGWRLPDPYWIVSLLAFLPLLPALQSINQLNVEKVSTYPSFAWRARDVWILSVGSLIFSLTVFFAFIPSPVVISGASLKYEQREYLYDVGVLAEGEEPLFFYSNGWFSIRDDGVVASDFGVTSYWIDPISEELTIAYLAYDDIESVEVNTSDNPLVDTVVRVTGRDGSWFVFFLPTEGGGDLAFLNEVESRRQVVEQPPRVSI